MSCTGNKPCSNRWLHTLLNTLLPALWLALAAILLAANSTYAQAADGAAQPLAAQGTIVDSNISADTTWTKAGSPYNVTENVFVEPQATLTIEPGVTVIVADASPLPWRLYMQVQGKLVARGTAAEPILFTGATKQPGSWAGLVAGNSAQAPAQLTLDHVIVEYGGAVSASYSANVLVGAAVADINNSTFRHSAYYGVSSAFSSELALRNSSFTQNGEGAVVVLYGPAMRDPVFSNLAAAGNGLYNAVVYDDAWLEKPHRLENMGLPYVLTNGFQVESGGELAIDAGVEVRVDTSFNVHGKLQALGAATNPILITGVKQQPGGWDGLQVFGVGEQIASAVLDHVTIEYGGSADDDWGGNLVAGSAYVTVTNSIVRNSASNGVFNSGAGDDEPHAMTIAGTSVTGNQRAAFVCADDRCNYALDGVTASGNGADAIVMRELVASQTWRDAGLPYLIEGDAGVMDGAALTLEPGVEVRMAQGASFAVDGVLTAVGTPARPIIFTGTEKQPGWWGAILVAGAGVANFQFCDIGYGGNWGPGEGSAQVMALESGLAITNCRIHDSANAGILVAAEAQATIRNNSFEKNKIGLMGFSLEGDVDARFNWWGDASGPKHPSNPNGQGQEVQGNVLFEPWLSSPDDTGGGVPGITVELAGPGRFAPGETVIYSVFYQNGTGAPIDNAVLRFGMPGNAVLVEASAGAIFHTGRNHLFWKLGSLPQGGQGLVWARVRYDAGLPDGLMAATAAQLSGSNLPAPLFDVAEYNSYVPRTLDLVTDLTLDQVNALLAGSSELNALYQGALADGFKFGSAEQHTYSGGQQEVEIRLLQFQPQFRYYSLFLTGGNAVGVLVDGSSYAVVRDGQAARYDMQSNAWSPVALGSLLQTAAVNSGISWSQCITNCIEDKLPGYIIKKRVKSLSELSKISSCVQSAQGNEGSYLGCAKYIGKVVPGVGEGIDLGQCNGECEQCVEAGGSCDNPDCHCCTEDKYRCDSGDWVYGTFGIDVVKVKRCNLDDDDDRGTYFAEEVIRVCAQCEKCMDSGGSPVCVAKVSSIQAVNTVATLVGLAAIQGAQDRLEVAASSDEECDECRQAKDPNEMYGPKGDLLPGQLVTYEIAYENIGEGIAFGVFIANKLPADVFDLATLQINDEGSYSAGAGSIYWDVGDLAPKGQEGAQGKVSYSVRLRSDLPSGTLISNSAVVHFPSVPEETPTNRLINVIKPLAADPQTLEVEAGIPLAITLSGRDAIDSPLTYTVVDGPLYGTLSGSARDYVYTPDIAASGLDRIRFTVSNGSSTSVPADVSIKVLPSSTDVTGPSVKWTGPAAGAEVKLAVLLAGTDSRGNFYYPAIQAQFSEALDPATVHSGTVIVTGAGGEQVAADVRYDAAIDQVQVLLRQEPELGEAYAVTITSGVKDLRGNPLAASHSWRFTITSVGGQAGARSLYLPVVAR